MQSKPTKPRPLHPFTCEFCGNTFYRRQRQRFCGLSCRSKNTALTQRGENHPGYKGRVQARGYILIFKPGHPLARADGYVMEHRLVLYEAGIDVPPGHHVHHINHDRSDNRLENLVVLTEHEHHTLHMREGQPVVNQYGAFKVLSEEERRAKQKARMAIWRAANKDRIRAYKDGRKAKGLPY